MAHGQAGSTQQWGDQIQGWQGLTRVVCGLLVLERTRAVQGVMRQLSACTPPLVSPKYWPKGCPYHTCAFPVLPLRSRSCSLETISGICN